MKVPTIEEEWQRFSREVIPKDAPPIQFTEMRNAFYAGFARMLLLCRDTIPELSDDAGVFAMEMLLSEASQFVNRLTHGK